MCIRDSIWDSGIHALGYMDIHGIQGYEDAVHHEDRGYMDMYMIQSCMVQVGVWGYMHMHMVATFPSQLIQ